MTQRFLRPARWLCAGLGLACAATAPAQTNPLAGLWVGSVTLDQVSEANPTISDLSFDLALGGQLIDRTLIAAGADWRFDDTGADLGVAWRATDYDDSSWSNGVAELGFGDGDEATVVSFGPEADNKFITTHFRHTFVVDTNDVYSQLTFRLRYDDGAVIYLNGAQIMRANLPAIYAFDTLASAAVEGTNEQTWSQFTVPGNLLAATNVVAVELHLAATNDADLTFDLELVGTVADAGTDTLLPILSTWKYNESGADLGTTWRDAGFDDSSWLSGAGQLGYGDGDEGTLIGFGPATNKNKITYFRNTFVVADTGAVSHLNVLMVRDDGAVVYINGQEVLRANMPATGAISFDTPPVASVGAAEENVYGQYQLVRPPLVTGTNVIAVSVHQHAKELGAVVVGAPSATPHPLELRLLLHVDRSGQVRLLKEVIQMWKDGTYTAVNGSNVTTATAGRYVLVTDDSLIPQFKGVGLRDGELVGRRVSAIGFDFDGTALDVAGTFAFGQTLTVSNALPASFRTNPFRHKFHPDHDNLDATYQNGAPEAPVVGRQITINLASRYPANPLLPAGTAPPGWGESRVGGTYEEQLTGLHKNPITVNGSFELQRVTVIDVLNDSP